MPGGHLGIQAGPDLNVARIAPRVSMSLASLDSMKRSPLRNGLAPLYKVETTWCVSNTESSQSLHASGVTSLVHSNGPEPLGIRAYDWSGWLTPK